MSPSCSGCGSHVSHDYIRVLAGNGAESVERCHRCSSKTEDKAGTWDE